MSGLMQLSKGEKEKENKRRCFTVGNWREEFKKIQEEYSVR